MAADNYAIAKGGMGMQDRITAVTYGSSGLAVYGGLTLTDWAAVIGSTVAVLSFLVNLWYRHKHYKLAVTRAAAGEEQE